MAVYTNVSEEDLRAFLAAYDLPPLVSYKGIAEGTENSNYLLRTEGASYILTLCENENRVSPDDVPFFLALMQHMSEQGVSCPLPVPARDGVALRDLCGRKAVITTFLQGKTIRHPLPVHCAELGPVLAKMHLAVADFSMIRANSLDLAGWQKLYRALTPNPFIADELTFLAAHWPQDLPRGVVHADLSNDNAFFVDDKLSGVFDFYNACNDIFAYDLAICFNAWCFDEQHMFSISNSRSLLSAYQAVRPLSPAELTAFPLLCRGAALRILLTRLTDWPIKPPDVRLDPEDYFKRLRFHQQVNHVSAYGLEL